MNYDWLKSEQGPKVVVEAVKLIGTKEMYGDQHNPEILAWAKEVGQDAVYRADEIPWCGLFAAVVVKRAGFDPVKTPLWARSWGSFGEQSNDPMLGDILVFTREGGGHVGFYVGEDDTCYHVLGGNQGDMVKVSRIQKNRLLIARRCKWKVSQPNSVRKIKLSSSGEISKNEQ